MNITLINVLLERSCVPCEAVGMSELDKFKELLEKYWNRVEDWATIDVHNHDAKYLMKYENKTLDVQNELIKMFKEGGGRHG